MGVELNFHQLRLFYTIGKLGSISRAAEELRISQPSVSAQVREFEQRCGVDLLHRLARGVALTDAGHVVFSHAERIFSQTADLQTVVEQLRGAHTGKLTVGGSLTAGEYFLPNVTSRFRARYPGVELSVVLGNSNDILAKVTHGVLDIGFIGTDAIGNDLIAIPCWEDEVVVIASPGAATHFLPTIKIVECQHFVMREPGSATRQHVEQSLQTRGMKLRTAMTVGSPEALKRHVAAGAGWGFASKHSVATEVATGQLAIVPIEGWDCRRIFSAVHRKRYQLSPSQREFVEFARCLDGRSCASPCNP